MRPNRIALIVAAFLGLLATVVLHRYLTDQQRGLEQERQRLMANYRNPIPIVVAGKDLPQGTALTRDHLTVTEVPERFIQPYATQDPSTLIGKVTMAPIAEGEQVLQNKVRNPEEIVHGMLLSSITPKGKRAVTIGVDLLTGVGGFVRPGDLVDVLWSLRLPVGGSDESKPVTLTLFQAVPVVAVGEQMERTASRPAAPASGARDQETPQQSMTLALDPQETSFLLFAREQGRIQVSLRSQADGDAVKLSPADLATLLEQQLGMRLAAPSAPQAKEVEVYKGLKRDVVVLPTKE